MPMNAAEQKRLEELKKELRKAHTSVNNMGPKVKGVIGKGAGGKGNPCYLTDKIANAKTQADRLTMEKDNRALGILNDHVDTFIKEAMKICDDDKLSQKHGNLFEVGKAFPKVLVSGDALFGSVDQFKSSEVFYNLRGTYPNACMVAIGQNMIAFGKCYPYVRDVLSRL